MDVEKWLSYKGACHVILPAAKLHNMYRYKTATFPHQPLLKVSLKDGSPTQVSKILWSEVTDQVVWWTKPRVIHLLFVYTNFAGFGQDFSTQWKT